MTIETLDQLVDLGGVHTALARALDALSDTAPHTQENLLAWLLSAAEGHAAALDATSRQFFRSRLDTTAIVAGAGEEYAVHLRQLWPVEASSPALPGEAKVILVAGHLPAVGVVRTLSVAVAASGGGVRLLHREDDEPSLYVGFWGGASAALDFAVRHAPDSAPRWLERLIMDRQVTGTMAASARRATGESLGLGAAMATLSALSGCPLAATDAFTGRVDRNGRVHSVGGITEKVAAAADAGCRRVFVPADGLHMTPPAGVEIVPCLVIGDAVVRAFSGDVFREALKHLTVQPTSPPSQRDWRTVPDGRPRALFTMVSGADPVGTYKNQQGASLPSFEDGPILVTCRDLRPARVMLFYTTTPGPNDYRENAERVRQFLMEQADGCEVSLHGFPETLDDPTDYEALWKACVREVRGLRQSADGDLFDRYSCFVNVSSGTPQIQFVWALLTVQGVMPATLLQVRESRRLKPGESRIRRVVLPSGELAEELNS